MTDFDTIIERHAQSAALRYEKQWADTELWKSKSEPERTAILESVCERWRENGRTILAKNHGLCERMEHGAFHPQNKYSRKLYLDLTGVCLPKNGRDTIAVMAEWLGPVWQSYLAEKENARRQAEIAEREIKEKELAERLENMSTVDRLIYDYAARLPAKARPRTTDTLNKLYRSNGTVMVLARLIAKAIREGATLKIIDADLSTTSWRRGRWHSKVIKAGARRLVLPDESFYEEHHLTKTAMNFAEWLITDRPESRFAVFAECGGNADAVAVAS